MNPNKSAKQPTRYTHEGAVAAKITPYDELYRSVMACLLFEDNFYEDGQSISDRIQSLVQKVNNQKVLDLIKEAKFKMYLRHAPLLLAKALINKDENFRKNVRPVLASIMKRPDDLTAFLSLYWADGKKPIPASVKKAFVEALNKFDEYQLAKYKQDDKVIKLRDIVKLVHPTGNVELFDKLCKGELNTPDTWEVAISAISKNDPEYVTKIKEAWTRLIVENRLGALAFLRNIRNMDNANVGKALIKEKMSELKVNKIFPYQFISAARNNPNYEDELEKLFFKAFEQTTKLKGETAILVDVSGSMDSKMSYKSEMTFMDSACSLAMIAREICENPYIFSFSDKTILVPNRRGFALRDAIVKSQSHWGTELFKSVTNVCKALKQGEKLDRMVIITDEQAFDNGRTEAYEITKKLGIPVYVLNVSTNRNGIGYRENWVNISGFSDKVFDYIIAREGLENTQAVDED